MITQARKYYAHDGSQHLKRLAENQMLTLVKSHTFNSILDIGFGDGHFLSHFPQKEKFGIDLSQSMVDLAKTHLTDAVLYQGDISDSHSIRFAGPFDIIVANYVFMQMKSQSIKDAFRNIHAMLDNGCFFFTITNPKTRHLATFPGYKFEFKEPFDYHKLDLEYEVLLETPSGSYAQIDVIDYHKPTEFYDGLLHETGFSSVKKEEIHFNGLSFALLYKIKK